MKKVNILTAILLGTSLVSCVSNKKFEKAQQEAQTKYDELNRSYNTVQTDLKTCNDDKNSLSAKSALLQTENDGLKKQVDLLKANNTSTLKQLEDMSVISAQQANNIKQSLENIGAKDSYIQTLQQSLARKDSMNLALVMNLKGAVGNLDDKDINIKVDKGVVYIDISDKLLFKSGQYYVTDKANAVLGKVAAVLKNQPDMEFMVEGHTDNVPYKGNGVLIDNWDLSVKRATAVVRILQKQYGLEPTKMAAAGRSEYKPIVANDTPDNRAINRRTRIVILPQLDQFFKLLETPKK